MTASGRRSSRPRDLVRLLAPAILVVVTALAFANAVTPAFVYDDDLFVAKSQRFDRETLTRLFHEQATAAANVAIPVYRPLAMATIAFDSSLHGDDARGYHASNVALHLAVTLAVYGLLRTLLGAYDREAPDGGTRLPALLAALLFGLHPIHTEAVDSIFNRSEILATGFVVAGLWGLARWVEVRPALAWALALGAYFFALLCKESAATFPVLAALLLWLLVLRGTTRERLRLLAPTMLFVLPAAAYLVLRDDALSRMGATIARAAVDDPLAAEGWPGRLALVVTTLRDHLLLILWPYPLRASYADYAVSGVLSAIAIHVVLLGAAVGSRRRAPFVTAGIGFFYLAMLPSSRVFTDAQLSTPVAERYLYLPSVGLALVLAFAARALMRRASSVSAVAAAAVPAVVFAVLTVRRNAAWHDNEALWSAEVAVAPRSGDAWMKLTTQYLHRGRFATVVALCDEHLAAVPAHAQLLNNCASADKALGRWEAAEILFHRSITLGGGAVVHANLARMYARTGRIPEAQAEFESAVIDEPDEAMKHVRRGEALFTLFHPMRDAEANREFEAALARDPRLKVAQDWLQRMASAGGS